MALLITPSAPITDPSLLTAQNIRNMATNLFNAAKGSMSQLYNQIWHNPLSLTPQQAFTSLGTDAVAAHQLFLTMSSLLNSVVAGSIPAEPAGSTVTENNDGTVSVTLT